MCGSAAKARAMAPIFAFQSALPLTLSGGWDPAGLRSAPTNYDLLISCPFAPAVHHPFLRPSPLLQPTGTMWPACPIREYPHCRHLPQRRSCFLSPPWLAGALDPHPAPSLSSLPPWIALRGASFNCSFHAVFSSLLPFPQSPVSRCSAGVQETCTSAGWRLGRGFSALVPPLLSK